MTLHQVVKPIIAKMLHVNEAAVNDDTDISALDQTEVMVQLIQKLQFSHGGASGFPKTYGELIQKLEEVQKMNEAPRFEIRIGGMPHGPGRNPRNN